MNDLRAALEMLVNTFALIALPCGMAAVWITNKQQQENIMAKLSELAGILTAANDKLDKVKTEVEALQASLTDVELPAAAQAALDRLVGTAQRLDDLNPDAANPTP